MASNGTGGRKKRAWRKPREPITPERDGASSGCVAKPVKLQRTARQLPDPTPPASEPEGKESELGKDLTPQGTGQEPSKAEDHKSESGDTAHSASGGVAVGVSTSSEGVAMGMSTVIDRQGVPLDIDGSVMEGVSGRI